MPYSRNPVVAALRRRRESVPLQVANGLTADVMPGPQVASDAPADAVRAAWQPLVTRQEVPMIGEVGYAQPNDHE